MCNCRNTYPLSVQLRMVAVREAIAAHASALTLGAGTAPPRFDDVVKTAGEIESFMRGDYTAEHLDEPPKQVPTMGAAYRSIVAQDLAKLGVLHADAAQQEKLADWISTGTA